MRPRSAAQPSWHALGLDDSKQIMAVEGGCLCGEVRYRISGEPVVQLVCFCRDCLAVAGTDGYAGYIVRRDDFEVTQGSTRAFTTRARSGRDVNRHFCGTCGSTLWGDAETLDMVSVAAGSLDDPTLFQPTRSSFTEDAPPWARIPRHLTPV